MPPPDDLSSLRDIRDAARLVALTLSEVDSGLRGADDWVVISAVERQLSIVGEAVKRLTFDFRDANPAIDWRRWAGLRDILVHAYDVVDTDQIWEIARDDVAELLDFLAKLVIE